MESAHDFIKKVKMKFKVCGLFNNENIQHVAELNPDYIGHIFWEKSVRYVMALHQG